MTEGVSGCDRDTEERVTDGEKTKNDRAREREVR